MGWQYVNPNCSRIRRGQVAGTYKPWDCIQPHNFLIGRINYKFSRNTNEVIVVDASLEFLTNTSTQSAWLTFHQMKRLLTNTISEISSSHGGEYDVQSCLLGYTAV